MSEQANNKKGILERTGEFDFENKEARLKWIKEHPLNSYGIEGKDRQIEIEEEETEKCICNEGIHDGKNNDCACLCHKAEIE